MKPVKSFIEGMPKAELHLHIEGTLEPELMFELALRNRVHLPFDSPDEVRRAYAFSDLQSFLDIYYQGSRVLLHDRDFFDLTWAYLRKAKEQNIRHTEVFFDPQAHTARGVPIGAVIEGIHHALANGERELGISSKLILCFLRDLSAEHAIQTLESALPYRDYVAGVGLDSSERGHPPEKFTKVFGRARDEGFFVVAHAGEEGPPEYVWQALDTLGVSRIDHGVRAIEDAALVERLRAERVPLTVCPLSNVKLRVFPNLRAHNLKQLLDRGLLVTVNSDDPAYFGGYVADNFRDTAAALGLGREQLLTLARNSFVASFLSEEQRRAYLGDVERFAAQPSLKTIS